MAWRNGPDLWPAARSPLVRILYGSVNVIEEKGIRSDKDWDYDERISLERINATEATPTAFVGRFYSASGCILGHFVRRCTLMTFNYYVPYCNSITLLYCTSWLSSTRCCNGLQHMFYGPIYIVIVQIILPGSLVFHFIINTPFYLLYYLFLFICLLASPHVNECGLSIGVFLKRIYEK